MRLPRISMNSVCRFPLVRFRAVTIFNIFYTADSSLGSFPLCFDDNNTLEFIFERIPYRFRLLRAALPFFFPISTFPCIDRRLLISPMETSYFSSANIVSHYIFDQRWNSFNRTIKVASVRWNYFLTRVRRIGNLCVRLSLATRVSLSRFHPRRFAILSLRSSCFRSSALTSTITRLKERRRGDTSFEWTLKTILWSYSARTFSNV